MKRKIKKIANMAVAVTMGYLPLVFPEQVILLPTLIIGMIAIVCVTYCILESITNR